MKRFVVIGSVIYLWSSIACGGGSQGNTTSTTSSPPVTSPPGRPKGKLSQDEAARYVLALVNYDRGKSGLSPVVWDAAAAAAGNEHARDMASNGYTGHVGTDGTVPEQRYSAAGGEGMVMENAGCVGDAVARERDPNPSYSAESLEAVEKAFMDEVPPADGHKKNILTPWHTGLGVGLSKPKGFDIACMAQEFVDDYGSYAELPKTEKIGATLRIKGDMKSKAKILGVGLARIDIPTRKNPKELLKTHSYHIPKPYVNYFPKGYQTPIELQINPEQTHFSIEVPLLEGKKKRPGLYEVSIWAELPGVKDPTMVSLRTITVRD